MTIAASDRRVLFCCRATPDYYRRPLFSSREVFCGPDCADLTDEKGVVSLRTPAGEYDLAAVVARLPVEQRPDLVVVKADATRGNFPRNLDRLPCPKALLVGDTHHFPAPLRHMLRYAGMESFEAIILDHTRQHAHFFQDAGFERVFWIPSFDYALRQRAIPETPEHALTFIGQTGGFHPYRRQVLEVVRKAGLPLLVTRAAPEDTATIQAASAITLNCSLNGDLNLRVFEALGAGAFLLTDRLSPESGLDRLFEAGTHLDHYATPVELVEKIRHYLAHPEEATRIRAAGQRHLLTAHSPAVKRRQFFDLLDHGRVDPFLDLAGERRGSFVAGRLEVNRRITAYEAVQQLHLRAERLTLLVDADDALAVAATARDLPRVRVRGYDHVLDGMSAPTTLCDDVRTEEVLALPWLEAAAAAPDLLARFQGDHVLAVGRSWRDGSDAAQRLARWGFATTGEDGLFHCSDPLMAADAAVSHAAAQGLTGAAWLAGRIARLCGEAATPEQAWRVAELAERVGDGLLQERALLRCLSLDRGHRGALSALARIAAAAGRGDDAALYAAEAARSKGGPLPENAPLNGPGALSPRLQSYRTAVIPPPPATVRAGRRLLVVTNLFPPQEFGGYGRKLWEFAAELRRRGHEIQVLAADVPAFAQPGVTGTADLEPLVRRSLRLYGAWRNGTAYMDGTPEHRAAVMADNDRLILEAAETFGAEACLAGNVDLLTSGFLTALPEQGIPVLHCVGNQHPGYEAAHAPRSPLYRLGPASQWVADRLDQKGFTAIDKTILYPGARIDSFHRPFAPAFDRLRIAFASLLTPYKGPQVLVNALAILHHNGVDFECVFAGEAPDPSFAETLHGFSTRFGAKVRFSGFLDRQGMSALFDRSNTLVFPSVFDEPFGITQVEAMAAGLTVLSSGSGGSGEIVEHGISGLISPPDDPGALAENLVGLLADRSRWARLSRNGQARAFAFTVARTVDRIEDAIAALLLKRAR